jgi:peptidoglycan/LPS O-acetylase OafA/YrhL
MSECPMSFRERVGEPSDPAMSPLGIEKGSSDRDRDGLRILHALTAMTRSPSNLRVLPHPRYRRDIDGLRAIAVLSVIGFHAFPEWFKGGFIGVDIFFVISGFLITTILAASLDRGDLHPLAFYRRRIRRIFPALALVLIACCCFGWFALLADEYKRLGKHVAAGAGFIANFVLWRESGYFDNAAETKPLLHLWSLAVEEQFYIIWPLLFWLAAKVRRLLLPMIALVAVASFAAGIRESQRDVATAFYSPYTRFWEIATGALLAYLGSRIDADKPHITENIQSLSGACLIAVGLIFITKDTAFPGWWALLPTLGATLIISAGPHAWLNRNVLSSGAFVFVGLISYPLYLWHWPLISFVHMTVADVPSPGIRIAAVLASIGLAWLTYRLIETPVRAGLTRVWQPTALLALMAAICSFGYYCYRRDGLPTRSGLTSAMRPEQVQAELDRYWSATGTNFDGHTPKVIVYGDSQAWDIFSALKNDDAIGLKIFQASYECSAFFSADTGRERAQARCQNEFDQLLNSKELTEADILIYTHYWERNRELSANYRVGAQQILRRNEGLKIYFFGPKPLLGKRWIGMNEIARAHPTPIGMNAFLKGIMLFPIQETKYAETVAKEAGAIFVDVNEIYCQQGCQFFVNDEFLYFDQDHWTEAGAKWFFHQFARGTVYRKIMRHD